MSDKEARIAWIKKYCPGDVYLDFSELEPSPENILAAAEHSLNKWIGLRNSNFYHPNERLKYSWLYSDTCALCCLILENKEYTDLTCSACPITRLGFRGLKCSSPRSAWEDATRRDVIDAETPELTPIDPEIMITELEEVVRSLKVEQGLLIEEEEYVD
jgi:hypothetical protein